MLLTNQIYEIVNFIYCLHAILVIMLSKQANRIFSISTSSQRNHHWVLDRHAIFRKRQK